MNKVVKVKGMALGEGLPKICCSMLSPTIPLLIEEANMLKDLPLDALEFRPDHYADLMSIEKVIEALQEIRKVLPDTPIVFTFRSKKEGGATEISSEYYVALNKAIVATKLVDIIDIELFNDEKDLAEMVEAAHSNGVTVIISNHDFDKTPPKEELVARMRKEIELGADIAKIAVMPNCVEDVLILLDATRIMKEEYDAGPLITMSMGGKGVISRLSGELFGSALSFAAGKKASAPGQVAVVDLRRTLELLHNN